MYNIHAYNCLLNELQVCQDEGSGWACPIRPLTPSPLFLPPPPPPTSRQCQQHDDINVKVITFSDTNCRVDDNVDLLHMLPSIRI